MAGLGKVDRAFVDGLGTVPGDEAIVRAVTAMASALHLGVVAEGVETAQQRDILRELGIQHGQGWLWGRAEAADVFELLWGAPGPAGTPTAPMGPAGRVVARAAIPQAQGGSRTQIEEANS